jgi:hypothetical protein
MEEMKIITMRALIKSVPERWKRQYKGYWISEPNHFSWMHYNALCLLDTDTCTPKDIYDIIGNYSWTTQHCDECKEQVDTLIHLGEEPDYESVTFYICPKCLSESVDLLFKETGLDDILVKDIV